MDDTLPNAERLPSDAALPMLGRIGPYELQGVLGEGGMGRVYLARERHPPRQVALKVVRGASSDLAARLRREIKTLAALEHPGIARLYAAGEERSQGVETPWLAMEYVRGLHLLDHVRETGADLVARLRLLVAVVRAVEFAHSCGVVHRDLKPGNILVDEQGRPKILDFGIAWRGQGDEATLTLAGQVLGTLPYMSPEQLSGGDRGADARSDVYSLGVIAYELIGGHLPHPRLSTSSLFEALDILRNETPPALGTIVESARGDLDTVVMKSLATDPAQRYQSAAEFADDLMRVLERRPVLARPPTLAYRATRFIARHRALSIAAGIVFVVLLAASLVSLRFALAEREAHAQAERRAAEAAAVTDFLQRMLASANPDVTRGRNPSLAEVVDAAEQELDQLKERPAVQRAVAATLSSTRRALGQFPAALALSDRALALPAADDPAVMRQLLRDRTTVLIDLERFDDARKTLAEARAAWPDAPLAERFDLDFAAARIDSDEGKVEEADARLRHLLDEAGRIDPAVLAANADLRTTVFTARSSLATLLRDSGRFDEAEKLTREVLDWRISTFGERAPTTLTARHNLGLLLAEKGDLAASEQMQRETLALQREVLGDDHASTLTTWQSLANVLAQEERFDEAEEAARASMLGFERTAGESHVQTLAAMNTLAYILEKRGRIDEAEAQYRRVIEIQSRTGSRHPSTFAPRNNLAMLLMDNGRIQRAEPLFASLVDDSTEAVGPEHLMTLIFQSNRGLCLSRMGRLTEARALLEPTHAKLLALVGAEHARTRAAAERLAEVYERLGQSAEAAALRTQGAP